MNLMYIQTWQWQRGCVGITRAVTQRYTQRSTYTTRKAHTRLCAHTTLACMHTSIPPPPAVPHVPQCVYIYECEPRHTRTVVVVRVGRLVVLKRACRGRTKTRSSSKSALKRSQHAGCLAEAHVPIGTDIITHNHTCVHTNTHVHDGFHGQPEPQDTSHGRGQAV